MKKLQSGALVLATTGALAIGATGAVSAATSHTASGNVGSSGIPKSVFKQDRLSAAAKVLDTTTAEVQSAHKDKTFDQLLTKAGLTKETYHQKLKAELTSELEAQGYSAQQVTIALQHKEIAHLRHHKKANKAS